MEYVAGLIGDNSNPKLSDKRNTHFREAKSCRPISQCWSPRFGARLLEDVALVTDSRPETLPSRFDRDNAVASEI